MGTVNTTLREQTFGVFPNDVSLASSFAIDSQNTNWGKIKLVPGETTPLSVTDTECGTNGAYIYLQAPTTNTVSIKLWPKGNVDKFAPLFFEGNLDQEALAVFESAFDSVITLKPGDVATLPIAAQQGSLYAALPQNSVDGVIAELDYLVSDRGGEWGQSINVMYTDNGDWNSRTVDVGLGEEVSRSFYGLTGPYFPSINDTWTLNDIYPIQDKGYTAYWLGDGNSQLQWRYFDIKGRLVFNPAADFQVATADLNNQGLLDGKIHWAIWNNGTGQTLQIFDGENIYVHLFENATAANIEYGTFDDTTANGSFLVYVEDYNGIPGNDAYVLINGGTATVLSNLNYAESDLFADGYVYNFANFVLILTFNDNTGYYVGMKIFNTSGILIQDFSFAEYPPITGPAGYNIIQRWFYGDGKFQLVCYNSSDPVDRLLLNYNEYTNRLVIDSNNTTDTVLKVIARYKTGIPQNQDIAQSFDPQSLGLLFTIETDEDNALFLNKKVTYAYMKTLFSGETAFTNTVIVDGDDLYMRYFDNTFANVISVGSQGDNTENTSDIFPNQKAIYLHIGDINAASADTGALKALIFRPGAAEPTEITIGSMTNYETAPGSISPSAQVGYYYDDNDNGIVAVPFGDYMMYAYYLAVDDKTVFAVYNSGGTLMDTLTFNGQRTYAGFWRIQYNSLLIRSWINDATYQRNWYFDVASNKFLEIPEFYGARDYVYAEWLTTGVNSGRMLLNWGDGNGYDYYRVLGPNGLSNKLVAPLSYSTSEYDWDFTSTNFFFFGLDPDYSDNVRIYVYDKDLVLRNNVLTGIDGWNYTNHSKKRFYLQQYGDGNAIATIATESSSVMLQWPDDNWRRTFNDLVWWND